MAKVTYDVSGVEAGGGGGTQPQPGVYEATIARVTDRRDMDGKNDLEVALNVGEEYAWVYTYIHFGEASEWKLAEFIRALALPEKGSFDPGKLEGKKLKVKINPDSYEGEYRGKPGRLMPMDGAEPDEAPDTPAAPAAAAATAEGFEATRESEQEKYDDWETEELKAEVEDRGLEVAGRKTKEKLMTALREDDAAVAGGGAAEPDAAQGDDYDEWELDELLQEAKDRELELPRGRKTKEKMIELLRTDDQTDPFAS